MTKREYAEYRQSAHWQHVSFLKKMHAEFRCEDCGATGVPLEAHHLHYRSLWREQLSDLVCCCRGCHQARHDEIERQKRDAYQPMTSDADILKWAKTGRIPK